MAKNISNSYTSSANYIDANSLTRTIWESLKQHVVVSHLLGLNAYLDVTTRKKNVPRPLFGVAGPPVRARVLHERATYLLFALPVHHWLILLKSKSSVNSHRAS